MAKTKGEIHPMNPGWSLRPILCIQLYTTIIKKTHPTLGDLDMKYKSLSRGFNTSIPATDGYI